MYRGIFLTKEDRKEIDEASISKDKAGKMPESYFFKGFEEVAAIDSGPKKEEEKESSTTP